MQTRLTFLTALVALGAGVSVGAQQRGAPAPVPLPKTGTIARSATRDSVLLAKVKAPAGFAVSLFAGPPVAMYPTCLTTAPDGSVYVCVDPNLSLSATKGLGRVMRLVDDDGDGKADRYSTFAELDSPRGLVADGRTVFVMHPPTLTAYRDTTGDGVADVSDDLVTNLGKTLDFRGADHTTNGITLGIDGWLYVAVGDYGFQNATGTDGRTITYRGGSVVRVRTDGTGLEMYATGTRNTFDLAVDPFLRVFTRDNTNDGDGWDTRIHYLARGADMGYPSLFKNFSNEHMPSLTEIGAGAGTGGLWVHDAGYPTGFGNTLYTGDWTLNKVFRHTLTRKGASFGIDQADFLTIPHPTDMEMDLSSNMFVSCLYGGNFNYAGDTIGFVVRVRNAARRPSGTAPTAIAKLTAAQLVTAIGSANATRRVSAQRELLRRPVTAATRQSLTTMSLDAARPAHARVAALFTLKQLIGAAAHPTIVRAAAQPTMRALALRALVDNETQLTDIDTALLVRSLRDTNPEVQLQAVAGLVRLGARNKAASIVPLVASADPAVAHVAWRGLLTLGAVDVALAATDSAPPATRKGVLRALERMHDSAVVTHLLSRSARVAAPDAKADFLGALARLFNKEAPWDGGWWNTKPSSAGPYFAPVQWEESPRIRVALRDGLLGTPQPDTTRLAALAAEYVRNRVLPAGGLPLLIAALGSRHPRASEVADMLIGQPELAATAIPLLTELDASSPAMHMGVLKLLAAEPRMPMDALPLVRKAALEPSLPRELWRDLLNAVGRIPGQPAVEATLPLFAAATPKDTVDGPVETAWRRFVGVMRRAEDLDFFIAQAKNGPSEHRTLAYSVLIQSVRSTRAAAAIRNRVTPVLDSTWSDRAQAAYLVEAIRIMRLETPYAARLATYRGGGTSPSAAAPPPPQTSSAPQEPRDWVQLFNGRDLSNWDIKFTTRPLGENLNNTFRVENGMLSVRYDQWPGGAFAGEWGHLFTKRAYSYYIVAAEYRFVGEQISGAGRGNSWAIRNNGIMVHSQSAASMGERQDFPISLEVQLLGGTGTRRTTGNLCTPGTHVMMGDRLVTAHCTNSNSQTYDGDQWVRAEVVVLGDSLIKHVINGDTVMTYSKPRMGGGNANNTVPGTLVEGKMLAEGFIALQAESAPIDFRKVEILDLVGCMEPGNANYRKYFVKSDPSACRR
jgi:glucose/arabinose dehydrogenase